MASAARLRIARSAGGLAAVAVAQHHLGGQPLGRQSRVVAWGDAGDAGDASPPRRCQPAKLFVPRIPYPGWDSNWDGLAPREHSHRPELKIDHPRKNEAASEKTQRRTREEPPKVITEKRHVRSRAPTRHIVLIRHGQYDETSKDDADRKLTSLGRLQALRTGERLGEILAASDADVVRLRCSTMTRARETRDLIAPFLPERATILEPDPGLAEGRPAQAIPGKPFDDDVVEKDGKRIEAAFKALFKRAVVSSKEEEEEEDVHMKSRKRQRDVVDDAPSDDSQTGSRRILLEGGGNKGGDAAVVAPASSRAGGSTVRRGGRHGDAHEWDVVVCHGNVIRYFVMRALQLPPEAWLRLCTFNCSVTYVVVRPSGSVSLRAMGDIGHLPASLVTFSAHHGFEW